MLHKEKERKNANSRKLCSASENPRVASGKECNGLSQPRTQYVHAVVSAFSHGIPFFIRPAGIGDSELGEAFGRNVRAFS